MQPEKARNTAESLREPLTVLFAERNINTVPRVGNLIVLPAIENVQSGLTVIGQRFLHLGFEPPEIELARFLPPIDREMPIQDILKSLVLIPNEKFIPAFAHICRERS